MGGGIMVEALFDELADGICISDANGGLRYLNPAAERLLDMTMARAHGRTLCEILCGHLAVGGASECASTCELLRPGSTAEAATFRGSYGPKEIASWKDFKVQRRSVWKNLRVRCLKSSSSLVGEGKHLTIIEDTSADLELERQKEDWRQMIAHDLRSPLTNIYATIRIFQDAEGGPLPAGSEKLVAAAERSSRKMLELINLYLDVAKLDAGVAEIKHVPVRMADTVRAEISEQAAVARGKKLALSSSVPEDLFVEADPDLLSRVVQNILDNAVKFTPPGGRVEVTARADGGQGVLAVKDSGAGIAAEELPLLFDRYHQARARRAGKLQGTGLGLTFCREALKVMGGSISVASNPKEGTEFVIRLPLAAQGKNPASTVWAGEKIILRGDLC
jgi:signal transduction histidine kinase